MAENSAIEWTDHTFNPWRGCTKVSDGCKNCYAETLLDKRYGQVKWGPQGERLRTSEHYWREPFRWNKKAEQAGKRAKVFCASLADVFEGNAQLAPWRMGLWGLIEDTPSLDWLLLTKRPENVFDMTPIAWWEEAWPANVWIGTSVENQEAADKRIPELLRIPAAVRFLSCEPLLGPINLTGNDEYAVWPWSEALAQGHGVNWVIVGGESGPGARPMHPDWARSLRDQCQEAGVPFLFKQWGSYAPAIAYNLTDSVLGGGFVGLDGKEYGHQHPEGSVLMMKMHKKAAGRLLDGREWNEFPQVEAVTQ